MIEITVLGKNKDYFGATVLNVFKNGDKLTIIKDPYIPCEITYTLSQKKGMVLVQKQDVLNRKFFIPTLDFFQEIERLKFDKEDKEKINSLKKA